MNNDFMRSFPSALSEKDGIKEYAELVARELAILHNDSNLLAIYSRIDELPSEILDILARDFNVKWYLYDGTLSIKRAQIKSCFYVHRHRGTVSATDTALSDLYPGSKVREWYDYGGNYGRYRIELTASEGGIEIVPENLYRTLNFYKRLSAVLEKVIIKKEDEMAVRIGIVESRISKFHAGGEVPAVYYCDENMLILTDEEDNALSVF